MGRENHFKPGYFRAKVGCLFPRGNREAKKTSQTFVLEKAASKLLSDFGKKTCKTKSAFLCNAGQSRPCFHRAL
jgi:hypothetical protein